MATISSKGGLIGFSFQVAGMAPMARVLGAMMSAVRDLRPVWEDLRDDFLRREQQLFDRQGAVPGWPGWKPLSDDYLKRKARKGYSPKIMVATGRLMHSLTSERWQGGGSSTTTTAADFVFQSRPLGMAIGTRVPYAVYHQDPQAPGRIKRPVIVVNEQMKRHWVKLVQSFLVESGQLERFSEAAARRENRALRGRAGARRRRG